MADKLLKFDFGFTAVDESELEAVQQITTKASSTEAEVKVLEDKLNNLYNCRGVRQVFKTKSRKGIYSLAQEARKNRSL